MGVDHNGQALDTHIENRLNLVWLKRELRLQDHPPQAEAMQPPGNVLLFYGFEPDPLRDPHDDNRRWRFVWPSLMELNQQLQASGSSVFICHGDVLELVFERQGKVGINPMYSHEKVDLNLAFERDKAVARRCKQAHIPWFEARAGAVLRAAKNRHDSGKRWCRTMRAPRP